MPNSVEGNGIIDGHRLCHIIILHPYSLELMRSETPPTLFVILHIMVFILDYYLDEIDDGYGGRGHADKTLNNADQLDRPCSPP